MDRTPQMPARITSKTPAPHVEHSTVSRHTFAFRLPGDAPQAPKTCRIAAQRMGWAVEADGAAGGIVMVVPRDLRLLRPRARLHATFEAVAGTSSSTDVRVSCDLPAVSTFARAQRAEIERALQAAIEGRPVTALRVGSWSVERAAVRVMIVLCTAAALAAAMTVSTRTPNANATTHTTATTAGALPAVALGEPGLFRLEVGLVVFYGALLVLTPFLFGVSRGKLPTEISTRGAKFEQVGDEIQESIKAIRASADDLEKRVEIAQDSAAIALARLNALTRTIDPAAAR